MKEEWLTVVYSIQLAFMDVTSGENNSSFIFLRTKCNWLLAEAECRAADFLKHGTKCIYRNNICLHT